MAGGTSTALRSRASKRSGMRQPRCSAGSLGGSGMTRDAGWSQSKLGSLLALEYGAPLPEPMRTGVGFPVFGSNGEVGRHSAFLVAGPGIVVGRKGSAGQVTWARESFWPIDTAYYVIPRGADLRWLCWRLRQLPLSQLHSSTGVPGLNRNDVYALRVPTPPLPEQRRIAEILDTLDEAIRKTEQLISKLKQEKQGLLHDLLTRGIDDHGEIRDPDRHPEHFRESPLGRIPRGWDVAPLGELYAEPARNGLYKPAQFHGRGPIMAQMGNIFRGLSVSFEDAGRVSVTAPELATYGLRLGDLLFGRRSLVMEGAGKCALVNVLPEPSTFESSIVRVRVKQDRVSSLYVAHFLAGDAGYKDRRRFIRQVAVSGVSGGDIAQFAVAVPPRTEQDGICTAMLALDSRMAAESSEADKLRALKQGLMGDLLAGRVRVTETAA
ncbi:MAG: restriction endonuclease subunit S [Anaeromyxobacteraceae bacterium]